jgi:hypothetical protein
LIEIKKLSRFLVNPDKSQSRSRYLDLDGDVETKSRFLDLDQDSLDRRD